MKCIGDNRGACRNSALPQSNFCLVHRNFLSGEDKASGKPSRFWRKASIGLLIAASVTGWYGTWAGYSTGFEQGSKDLNQTALTQNWQKGFDAGKLQSSKESLPQIQQQVDVQVRAKVQEVEDDLNRQMQQRMMQAFNQGAAAQAKAMADRAVGFSVGMPKQAGLIKK